MHPEHVQIICFLPVEQTVPGIARTRRHEKIFAIRRTCLLYTSDAADERSSVDLGGRRIIKKKNNEDIGVRQIV